MRCKCNVEPRITMGKPVENGGKNWWCQQFTCVNENCQHFGKVIGERLVNAQNEAEMEIKSLI